MLIQLNLKKYKILNRVLKKYSKITNRNTYGAIKNLLSFQKKCNNFSKTIMLKYITPTLI